MARASITKRTVDAAKVSTKDLFIWDTELSGFGLKVTPSGGKIYVYQYRIAPPGEAAQTAAKRYTIGKHGNLTPEQARKRARELAALVEGGVDPRQRDLDRIAVEAEAMRRARELERIESELAFKKVAALWLDYYENEKERRPSSVSLAKLVVNSYLIPKLGDKPAPHVGRADLQPILDNIPSSRKGMRRAVFAYASVLFGWLAKRGDIPANPLAAMVKPEAPKSRDRVLDDDELATIWEATSSLNDPFGAFFRLLILTGQRRSEVANLAWQELDRTTLTWTIPAGRAKNGVAHIVPLSSPVVEELDALACMGGAWPKTGFVFTTTGTTPISGISKAKLALDAAAAKSRNGEDATTETEIPSWRIHDLRRTLATGFQRLGIRFEVTEAVLNHVSGAKGGIAGIYQRHDWKDEKRTALDAWARHVEAETGDRSASNVVVIGSGKAVR